MTNRPNNPDSGAEGVRCLLLAPAGATPESLSALERALRSRGLEPERVRDGCDLMARAVGHERRSRASLGAGGRLLPLAVILADPDRLDRVLALADALEKHVRGVTIWRYDADAAPALRLFERPRPTPVPMRNGRPAASPPTLRLAGLEHRPFEVDAPPTQEAAPPREASGAGESAEGDEATSETPEHEPEEEASPSSLLTNEELEMLLSDEPLPPRRGDGRPAEGGS